MCSESGIAIRSAAMGSTGSGWGGSGLGWHLCSGCAKSEEWVTFLYEKMGVMGGVSEVGNHEQVQPDRGIECFSDGV